MSPITLTACIDDSADCREFCCQFKCFKVVSELAQKSAQLMAMQQENKEVFARFRYASVVEYATFDMCLV